MLTDRTVVTYHWSSTVETESVTTPASPLRRLIKQNITNNNKNQQQQQQTIKNRETVNLKNTTTLDVSMVSPPYVHVVV